MMAKIKNYAGKSHSNFEYREQNQEVYYAVGDIVKISKNDIQLFRRKTMQNKRLRSRLCTHKDIHDNLHEMFIMYSKAAYIRPHRHPNKSVSYHIVEGCVDVILFNEAGNVKEIIRMGDYLTGLTFYFRISDPHYYMPIPRSDFLVFEEITNGPFNDSHTVFAPWAPDDGDNFAVKKFMNALEVKIKRWPSN